MIDDLAGKEVTRPTKELKIRDSHQYFSSVAAEASAGKPSKTKALIEPFQDAVRSALEPLQQVDKKQKRVLQPDVASQVLRDVTQSLAKVEDLSAQFASHQSFTSAEDAAAFPEDVDVQLKRSAATGGELLKQFWMATPMITSVRWEKATKVSKSIEVLYDRLESLKGSLSSTHRHIASQRLRPLLGAFDSALTFSTMKKLVALRLTRTLKSRHKKIDLAIRIRFELDSLGNEIRIVISREAPPSESRADASSRTFSRVPGP